ncbi:hypothetical protein KOW79_008792 [Hemibagrus wyckioides]|uniref:Uncharacterized protein n=1 Tax=Hemibagrus wyckioides TaxID=337641 RepID=A0A9D3SJU5_9TELE|nr:hypothetical protein KOW79_008792 [Hemibagrus wyckioides]
MSSNWSSSSSSSPHFSILPLPSHLSLPSPLTVPCSSSSSSSSFSHRTLPLLPPDIFTLSLLVHPSSSPHGPTLIAHDLLLFLILFLLLIRSSRALSHPSSSSSLTLSNCAPSFGNFQQHWRKHLSQKSAASAGGSTVE